MLNEIREVRREIKLTYQENKILEDLLRKSGAENFSVYARRRLLGTFPDNQMLEKLLSDLLKIELLHEVQHISREISRIRGLAEGQEGVTEEHVSIILRCVQELNQEVSREIPLSKEFKDKYILN
ncbi:TPA: hypothetical protein U1032_002112 [Streptococcus suis]|nr:hypothetical protein [Streptococcus suis]HEM4698185.1 hypothetical protein [Streptococcus suis]HEM4702133.1 hypothetical protein [Streptococcus suis]HEM4702326.1 hypothetical protein [Streptococcus suis]HEM4718893.1 hypothetical protein [Streptococcus suis]